MGEFLGEYMSCRMKQLNVDGGLADISVETAFNICTYGRFSGRDVINEIRERVADFTFIVPHMYYVHSAVSVVAVAPWPSFNVPIKRRNHLKSTYMRGEHC